MHAKFSYAVDFERSREVSTERWVAKWLLLSQAAINYFHINGGTGQAYFDPEPPAVSQSSNIMLDLVFSPMDGEMSAYVATKGDAIGLAIRVTNEGGTLTQQPPREILRNADVIRATEVVEAAPPGTVRTQ
jgi:hypothetical protein